MYDIYLDADPVAYRYSIQRLARKINGRVFGELARNNVCSPHSLTGAFTHQLPSCTTVPISLCSHDALATCVLFTCPFLQLHSQFYFSYAPLLHPSSPERLTNPRPQLTRTETEPLTSVSPLIATAGNETGLQQLILKRKSGSAALSLLREWPA